MPAPAAEEAPAAGEEPAAEPEAPASPMEQEEEAEGGQGLFEWASGCVGCGAKLVPAAAAATARQCSVVQACQCEWLHEAYCSHL